MANEPSSSTAITGQPAPASSTAITSKPPPPAMAASLKQISPQTFARRLFRFDMVLLALVLIFAFFLGSFTAYNTDLFLHLSLGSPFGSNADESGWVHHAWLTSVLLGAVYEPYSPDFHGMRHAIIVKALIVVLLAVVLALIRRRPNSALPLGQRQGMGAGWFLPICFAALAVLVVSPRLMMQPVVMSYLFLAVTLWILTLPSALYPRAIWALPVLFMVWVNMDEWFLLGPMTVLLWLAGEWFQRQRGIEPAGPDVADTARLKQLAKVLGVGIIACFINPWFHRALVLPVDLAVLLQQVLPPGMTAAGRMAAEAQIGDPSFMQLKSPISSDYMTRTTLGLNTAGMTYFALLILGAVSFVLPVLYLKPEGDGEDGPVYHRRVNVAFLVVFAVFAAPSLLNFRLIPFFAIVAGPITALNFQDFLRRRRPPADTVTKAEFNLAFGSRCVALVACVALLACAWPGWLHGNPGDWKWTRHVAWDVAEDPGILDAAKVIHEVNRQTGLCKLGFSYTTEGGNLLSWPARHSEAKVDVFVDARFGLYVDRAAAFGKIRKALRDEAEILFAQPKTEQEHQAAQSRIHDARRIYQDTMRANNIDYVVLTRLHHDPQALRVANSMLVDLWRQWVLLYHDGRTAVFAWIDPNNKNRDDVYRKYRLDFYRMTAPAQMPPNMPIVVLKANQIPPPPLDGNDEWQQYVFGPPRVALSSIQAGQYVDIFNFVRGDWQHGNMDTIVGSVGGAGAVALGWSGKPLMIVRKDQQGQMTEEPFFKPRDLGPPAAPILAVRAARNAIGENPNDANAYISLGGAYRLMWAQDDYFSRQLHLALLVWPKPPLRHQFRQTQILSAFLNAAAAQPNNSRIHSMLHDIYRSMGCLDLAADHLVQVKLGAESQKLPAKDQEKIDQLVKAALDDVQRRKTQYELRVGTNADVTEKFKHALIDYDFKDAQGRPQQILRGTVKLALQVLQEVKPENYPSDPWKLREMVSWQLYLMLVTGQAREVADLLNDEKDDGKKLAGILKDGDYEQMRAMAAAALGDYALADKLLAEAEKARRLPPDAQLLEQLKKPQRQIMEHFAGSTVVVPGLDGYAGALQRLAAVNVGQTEFLKELQQTAKAQIEVAELRLIRGLLALEAGDTIAAAKHFRGCLDILPPYLHFPDRPIAIRYLELLEAK